MKSFSTENSEALRNVTVRVYLLIKQSFLSYLNCCLTERAEIIHTIKSMRQNCHLQKDRKSYRGLKALPSPSPLQQTCPCGPTQGQRGYNKPAAVLLQHISYRLIKLNSVLLILKEKCTIFKRTPPTEFILTT